MRLDDVDSQLSELAFRFFYWFSRFEFALKENGYLKFHTPGENAEPGWDEFVEEWCDNYVASPNAEVLLTSPPERQIVQAGDELAWRAVGLYDCRSELAKVVRLLKTIRNNLFHGGKHSGAGWDDPRRTEQLLAAGIVVLDQLADLAKIRADYAQYY
jgi:hypothetical protein